MLTIYLHKEQFIIVKNSAIKRAALLWLYHYHFESDNFSFFKLMKYNGKDSKTIGKFSNVFLGKSSSEVWKLEYNGNFI